MTNKLSAKWSYLGLIALTAFAFLLYLKSLKIGFISDDFNLIFDYKDMANPFSGNRWLPIQGAYYWLINLLDFNLVAVRSIFFAFFIINILLVFKIIFLLTNKRIIALLSAFIFTLFYRHPMVIYWLPGSLEILLLTFFLSSILFFIIFRQSKKKLFLGLSLAFFVLSLLCKESAIVLPLILFLVDFFVFKKLRLKIYSWFIGLSIIYLAILFLTALPEDLFLTRGGYHAVGLNQALINYANILAAFLPLKFDRELISTPLVSYFVVGFSLIFFLGSLLYKKIPREIPLFLGIILITIAPYAFFSPFGFQDKYLFLSSFAFSGLIAFSIFKLIERFGLVFQFIVVTIFCLIFGGISVYLISHRAFQWQVADQIIKRVQKDIAHHCSALTPQSNVFLINFPRFINNQVFILNNGLTNMMKFTCKKKIAGSDEIFNDLEAGSFLKNSQDVHQPISNLVVFAYESGKVMDYSNKYKYLEDFLHSRVTSSDFLTTFDQPRNWFILKASPENKLKIKKEDKALVLEYYIFPGSWVAAYHKDIPILYGTKGISVDVFGDSQQEILYFDLFDKETGEYFRFSQKIDWQDWKTLQIPYSSAQLIGKTIGLKDVDDLKISIDSNRKIESKIKIKNFKQY
jgi:hypothetical protein